MGTGQKQRRGGGERVGRERPLAIKAVRGEIGKFVVMENKKPVQKIKRIRRNKNDIEKGVDTLKFCGVIKLKEDPLAIQKKLRDE